MSQATQKRSGATAVDPTGLHRPIKYRPDVDGLRAIAVTSVVAYHCGLPGVHGGFVGVDVFFVISGYLIGSLVYKEIRGRSFSIARFYERRAKRILPALCGVLFFSYAAALLLLSPLEMKAFAGSAMAAVTSSSNIYFWKTTGGYFATRTDLLPMLMTWSLGVEEQFYILFPLLMLLLRKASRRVQFFAILLLAAASLGASAWGTHGHTDLTFYMLPTRAWELAAGVLLAIFEAKGTQPRTHPPRMAAHVLSVAGLASIVIAIVALNQKTPFPGFAALLPVGGAVLIIAARDGVVNRAISWRPIVFIGLISYSWYLWHWPLLSFARICSDADIGVGAAAVVGAVSFGCAALSYKFIEQPFRKSKTPTMPLLRRYGALAAATLLPALIFSATRGLPQRYRAVDQLEFASLHLEDNPCLAGVLETHPRMTPPCAQPGEGPAIALIGDSHAGAISEAMRVVANRAGYRLVVLAKSGCPALEGVSVRGITPARGRSCTAFNHARLDEIVRDPSIRMVAVVQFWSLPFRQARLGDGYVEEGHDSASYSDAERWDLLRTGLSRMVDRLQTAGKTVYIALDNPSFSFDPMRHMRTRLIPARRLVAALVSQSALRYPEGIAPDLNLPEDREAREIVLAVAVDHPQVHLLDMRKALCTADGCRFAIGDQALYGDADHLFALGAQIALTDLRPPQAGQAIGPASSQATGPPIAK